MKKITASQMERRHFILQSIDRDFICFTYKNSPFIIQERHIDYNVAGFIADRDDCKYTHDMVNDDDRLAYAMDSQEFWKEDLEDKSVHTRQIHEQVPC